tara:strand:+ start:238 stop:1005 length:768 start_codon:yes stop_codon:yes gene_type:complete
MKKIFTIVSALVLSLSISAQSWTDRWNDDSYLPESGDWSIGFDATSTLNYFGNLLNSNATAPTAGYVSGFNQAIYGKLMTSDNEAWRIRVGLNMTKEIDNTDVPDANDPNNTVTDKNSVGKTDINLYLGKEFRKGKARLQGVYGAEAGLAISSETEKNEFGNSAGNGGVGIIEDKSGLNFGISLRGFIGFEYFMLPSMSIGGEYGWAFGFLSEGGGSTTTLNFDGSEDENENANDSSFGFSNDNSGGSLVLRMYF